MKTKNGRKQTALDLNGVLKLDIMMNIKQSLSLFFSISILFSFNSCSDEQFEEANFNQNTLDIFAKNFPDQYEKLDYSSFREGKVDNIENEKGEVIHIGIYYKSIDIVDKGVLLGSIVEIDGQSHYVEKKSKTMIYNNLENLTKKIKFDLVQKDKNSNYQIPDFDSLQSSYIYAKSDCNSWSNYVCAAGCTIASIAIAASDGPSPFMDILAVAYQGTCLAGCAIEHGCK